MSKQIELLRSALVADGICIHDGKCGCETDLAFKSVVESYSAMLAALKKAQMQLGRRSPCPHDNLDTRYGNGKIWARCEDCGVLVDRERISIFKQSSERHEKVMEDVHLAIKLAEGGE